MAKEASLDAETEYTTIARICALFSVSAPTVYRMIRDKHIRAVKVGYATRVDMNSVRSYFANLPEV